MIYYVPAKSLIDSTLDVKLICVGNRDKSQIKRKHSYFVIFMLIGMQ